MRFLAAVLLAALALRATNAVAAPAPFRAIRSAASQGSDDLPDGDGKKILQTSCTVCHDLTEVTKFKGYYTRDDWRDIIKTMIEYGAKVKESDVEVLLEYLTKNLGKK